MKKILLIVLLALVLLTTGCGSKKLTKDNCTDYLKVNVNMKFNDYYDYPIEHYKTVIFTIDVSPKVSNCVFKDAVITVAISGEFTNDLYINYNYYYECSISVSETGDGHIQRKVNIDDISPSAYAFDFGKSKIKLLDAKGKVKNK